MKKLVNLKKRGLLIVVSGPSGAGKDTVVGDLIKNHKNIWLSISCTSRSPRSGEEDGINYFFLSKEQFEEKINQNKFLEYAEYNDNYYGTLNDEVEKHLENGEDVVLIIEVQGALKVQKLRPECIFIFILPPSMRELQQRLINRGTENKEKIFKRFKTAYKEINELSKYNYVVVNENVHEASENVYSIINSEKLRVDRIEEVYLGTLEEELHEDLVDFNN